MQRFGLTLSTAATTAARRARNYLDYASPIDAKTADRRPPDRPDTMAPPHLHPRSRMTSSLFATTVFASFFVVVLPHILPCPAPRVTLSDGQMTVAEDGTVMQPQRRRRRRRIQDEAGVAEGCAAGAEQTAEKTAAATEEKTTAATAATAAAAAEVQRGDDGMARFAMVSADESTATSAGAVADAYAESATSFVPGPRRATRECPVPKPGGIVGELLGFKSSQAGQAAPQPQQPQSPQHTPLEK